MRQAAREAAKSEIYGKGNQKFTTAWQAAESEIDGCGRQRSQKTMGTIAESDIYGRRIQNFTAWQAADSGVRNLRIAVSEVYGCVADTRVRNSWRAES